MVALVVAAVVGPTVVAWIAGAQAEMGAAGGAISAVFFGIPISLLTTNLLKGAGWAAVGSYVFTYVFGIGLLISIPLAIGLAEPDSLWARAFYGSEKMKRSRATSNPAPRDKRCPDCAEVVKIEARVCKHCGYRFAQQV